MNRWIFLDTRTPRGACTWNLGLDVIPIRPIQVKGSAGFMEGSRSSLLFIGMGGLGARAIEVARRLYPEAAFRITGLQSPAGQGTADAADMLMEADRIVILGEFGNRREGVLLADLMSEG